MRSASAQVAMVLVVAVAALLTQCRLAATPPEYANDRWGMIVLYEKGDTCTHLAGPPRIGAYPGNRIIWRIFNNCQKEARVEITDLRRNPSDRAGFTYARSVAEINEVRQKRQDDKVYRPEDPFDPGARGKTVAGRGNADYAAMDELSLKVKDKGTVQAGLYSYIVTVNGNPDEGDIDIWP